MSVTIKRVNINTDAALAALVAQLTPRLEAVGDRIALNARKNLESQLKGSSRKREQRTKEPGTRSQGESIVLASARGLTPRQAILREKFSGEFSEPVFRGLLANRGKRTPTDIAREVAPLFRFKNRKGKPDIVALQKGILKGVSIGRAKPHLIDTIRNEGVEFDGTILHLTVAARSDHANLVEHGFHHKGDGQIAARPFLLPALQAEREGLATGRSLKG